MVRNKNDQAIRFSRDTWAEPVVLLIVLLAAGTLFAGQMGLANMLNTIMNTAYELLLNTAFYIMAIAVMMGALSALLTEFRVTQLLNRILSPLMKPLYGLPGAAALGIVTTYLSDNPAILTLADNDGFRALFKRCQLPALSNIGTSFGMGLIVSTFMLGLGSLAGGSLGMAVLVGNLGAVVGSIVSTRLMLFATKRYLGGEADLPTATRQEVETVGTGKKERLGNRVLNAALVGGKAGVKLGMEVIPGILIICTLVLMLTNAPASGVFTGAASEGIGLLPAIAQKLNFLLQPLFGFESANCVAVPITALGSAGAAIALIPNLLRTGAASAHDIAVFTSMCMCWSGYLSTHVSMMDALGFPELSGKAIACHTVGGLTAGVAANWLYKAFILLAA